MKQEMILGDSGEVDLKHSRAERETEGNHSSHW